MCTDRLSAAVLFIVMNTPALISLVSSGLHCLYLLHEVKLWDTEGYCRLLMQTDVNPSHCALFLALEQDKNGVSVEKKCFTFTASTAFFKSLRKLQDSVQRKLLATVIFISTEFIFGIIANTPDFLNIHVHFGVCIVSIYSEMLLVFTFNK